MFATRSNSDRLFFYNTMKRFLINVLKNIGRGLVSFTTGLLLLPSGLFSQEPNEPDAGRKPYYLQISPGVSVHSTSLYMSGHGFNGTMGQSGYGDVSWSLDMKSPDFVFYRGQKYQFGVYLLVHSGPIKLTEQTIEVDTGSSSSGSSSSSGGSSSSFLRALATEQAGPTTRTANIGTRMDGFYTYAVPAFYFGGDEWTTFRVGMGIGVGNVQMSGTVDMQDYLGPFFIAMNLDNGTKEQTLRSLSAYQLMTGLVGPSTDPIRTIMLASLDQPGMLENYGAYALAKGWVDLNGDSFLQMLAASILANEYSLNHLETFGLLALQRSSVEVRKKGAAAFLMFVELPIARTFKFRVSFGGPFFYYQGYHYRLTGMDFALYMPVEI